MKVICPISGITFAVQHPIRGSVSAVHPLLAAPVTAEKLTDWYLKDWAEGNLSATDTHLFGLALLQKLPVTEIKLPELNQETTEATEQFWAGNIEKIAGLAVRLDSRPSLKSKLPHIRVTQATFSAIPDWLKDVTNELNYRSLPISEKAKELNRESYKASTESSAVAATKLLEPDQIENLVLRALRGSPLTTGEGKALPVILSDWANKVAPFPQHTTIRWQRAIQTIFHTDYINQMLMSDVKLDTVKALEDHLMENSPTFAVGTTHHTILMQRLAAVIPVLEDFSPVVSARKKVSEDDLVAALDGTAVQAKAPAPMISGQKAAPRPGFVSLADKLAARLAAAKNKQVSEGDL